jgi:hypothetical protein
MANMYYCSDGTRVSQATIDRRRSQTYRDAYGDQPKQYCRCGKVAQGSSHIVSQMRCKHLQKSDLIWLRKNFVPACNSCNSRWESNDEKVPGYDDFMEVMRELDLEGYLKRIHLKK